MHILSLVTENNPSWMIQQKGGEWQYKLFHEQSPLKYGIGLGTNSRSLDLRIDLYLLPDTLPTALGGPVEKNQIKNQIVAPLFGAAQAAPNKGTAQQLNTYFGLY